MTAKEQLSKKVHRATVEGETVEEGATVEGATVEEGASKGATVEGETVKDGATCTASSR